MKLRLNLFAIIALCGYGMYVIQGLDWQSIVTAIFTNSAGIIEIRNAGNLMILTYLLDGILLLAAVSILFFSCFKIQIAPDGRFCYDPQNPYWKFMRSTFEKQWGERISLCRSYWLTVLFETYLLIAIAFCFIIYSAVAWMWEHTFSELFSTAGSGIAAVGVLILIYAILPCMFKLTGRFLWLQYVWWSMLVGLFVILPFTVMLWANISFVDALLAYLKVAGPMVGIVLAIIGLVWAAFRYIPALRNTWLGQTLAALKSKACPILYECPVPKTKVA